MYTTSHNYVIFNNVLTVFLHAVESETFYTFWPTTRSSLNAQSPNSLRRKHAPISAVITDSNFVFFFFYTHASARFLFTVGREKEVASSDYALRPDRNFRNTIYIHIIDAISSSPPTTISTRPRFARDVTIPIKKKKKKPPISYADRLYNNIACTYVT